MRKWETRGEHVDSTEYFLFSIVTSNIQTFPIVEQVSIYWINHSFNCLHSASEPSGRREPKNKKIKNIENTLNPSTCLHVYQEKIVLRITSDTQLIQPDLFGNIYIPL